jgi:hypothetical protein
MKPLYETLDDGKSSIIVSRDFLEEMVNQGKLTIAERTRLNVNAPGALPWDDRIFVRVTGETSPILRRLYPGKAEKA